MRSTRKNLYLLGHPVDHSKSPVIHNVAYQALGLNWHYDLMDKKTESEARSFLSGGHFLALNITTPYKPLALSVAQHSSPRAWFAGGANVVIAVGENRQGNDLYADNTDGAGFIIAFNHLGIELANKAVVVCGTGPVARSIMNAALNAHVRSLTLLGRDASRTAAAVNIYRQRLSFLVDGKKTSFKDRLAGSEKVQSDGNGSALKHAFAAMQRAHLMAAAYTTPEAKQALKTADIVIDATTLGMNYDDPAPFDTALLNPQAVVFDTTYVYQETTLMRQARACGCRVFNGGTLLVGQAEESLRCIAKMSGCSFVVDDVDLFSLMARAADIRC